MKKVTITEFMNDYLKSLGLNDSNIELDVGSTYYDADRLFCFVHIHFNDYNSFQAAAVSVSKIVNNISNLIVLDRDNEAANLICQIPDGAKHSSTDNWPAKFFRFVSGYESVAINSISDVTPDMITELLKKFDNPYVTLSIEYDYSNYDKLNSKSADKSSYARLSYPRSYLRR